MTEFLNSACENSATPPPLNSSRSIRRRSIRRVQFVAAQFVAHSIRRRYCM